MAGADRCARALASAALAFASAACETPPIETPRLVGRSTPATVRPAPMAPPAATSAPAAPRLPTVIWLRGAASPPLPPDFASKLRDPFAAHRSSDGTREGRLLMWAEGAPAAELVDILSSAEETSLVVEGADSVGFAGSLFWAFGGLGAVLHDGATNEVRTVPMEGRPDASPDGSHLAFVAGDAVYVVDTRRIGAVEEIFRGDLTSGSIEFADDRALIVPTTPPRFVPLDGSASLTLPPDGTQVELSPKGRFIAVTSPSDEGVHVSLLARADGRVIGHRQLEPGHALASLAWSADEAHLIAAASPHSVWVMRSADGSSTRVPGLEHALLVADVAVTAGREVCLWPRTRSMTTCEGSAVHSLRESKPLPDDRRVCLRQGGATALVAVDRARYLPLLGPTGNHECRWVLSSDGRHYAGVHLDPRGAANAAASGAASVQVVDVASGRVVHDERVDDGEGIELEFFGAARLEITSKGAGGQRVRRQITIRPTEERER